MDFSLLQFINNLSGKFWLLDWLGIFLADYLGYLLVFIFLILLLKEKNWRQRIYFASLASLSVILSRGIITEAIRFFYYRPRPFAALGIEPLINHGTGGSFPSGHAAAFFALALAVFYLNKKCGLRFLGAAALIGLGRIFAGVHWPSDILAGAIIGLISVIIIKNLLLFPETKIKKEDIV